MPTLPITLSEFLVTDGNFRRLSESGTESDHDLRIRNSRAGYTQAAIDQSSHMSRGLSIVLATFITVLLIGVVFVAVFEAYQKRTVAASLVASQISHRSYTQRQNAEVMRLLRKNPREIYMAWAAKTEISSPGKLPTDPLCVICFDTVVNDDPIVGLPCLHFFHNKCFDDMCVAGITRCPMCQRSMLALQEDEAEPELREMA